MSHDPSQDSLPDPLKTPLTRRQLLALGGGAVAAAALSACGGDSDSSETTGGATGTTGSSGTTAPSGSTTGTSAAGGSGGDGGTIQQWYHQYGEEGTQQAVERYAAAYPNADVKVTWQPGDYDQTTAAALLTDSGPDVFEYGNGPTIDMIQAGQVVDMTDMFGDAKSDFMPAAIERLTYDGKIWAIPQVIDMQILVYNKTMLADAGIEPPTTIDEMIEASKALTKDGVKGMFLGNDGGGPLLGGPMLWAVGQNYLTDDNKFGFDNETAANAFSKLRELWESETLLLGQPDDWWSANAIISEQCAMQWTGLWTFPDLNKGLPDNYGAIPWPKMDGGSQSVPVGAFCSCVSAKATDVDAAKEFAKWLWVDQTEDQLDFATAYGFHVPSRQSLIPKAETLESGPASDAAKAMTEYGHYQNQLLWTPASQTAFSDMMTRIVKEGADPMQEITELKKTVDEELARVGG